MSQLQRFNDQEATSYLLMANYAYSDVASVTARFSSVDLEGEQQGDIIDGTKITLAHNYAFSDNLALCAEVSQADGDVVGQDAEVTSFAVELLFTF